MYVRLGPTVGAAFTLLLAEGLRLGFGNKYHALDSTVYGLMLVLFIIYMPKGILGGLIEALGRKRSGVAAVQPGINPPSRPSPSRSSST